MAQVIVNQRIRLSLQKVAWLSFTGQTCLDKNLQTHLQTDLQTFISHRHPQSLEE